MAGLEVDEVEACGRGVHCGSHEVVGQRVQLVIGQKWMVEGGPSVASRCG